MIEIKNLTKKFQDNLVWQDVSFTISEGETIAIIGRSGCGKSVLVKHLNALMYPTEGEVIIDDMNVFELEYIKLRKLRQRFGILFQGSALFDSINTFDNVAFPLRYFTDMDEDEIESKVMESLEMVNHEETADQDTADLSGGMRRRVALARAVVLQPDFLVYDEPTTGLDPQTSSEINKIINHLSDNLSITSIVVTHDIHSVLEVADEVAFLDNKKLAWKGSIEKLKKSDDEDLLNFITASEYKIN